MFIFCRASSGRGHKLAMAEYSAVKGGKLKLKGGAAVGSHLKKKKKTKRKKLDNQEEWMKEPGAVRHGIY